MLLGGEISLSVDQVELEPLYVIIDVILMLFVLRWGVSFVKRGAQL